MIGIQLAESGLLPDTITRIGIRRLLRQRLHEIAQPDAAAVSAANESFRRECSRGPIALVPDLANEQHYEVAPGFYQHVLGPHLKYSCGLWPEGVDRLEEAEARMLALSCERAEIVDGMEILDLGCGWGSLSLWIAERYPAARVLAVSNSKPQREFILGRCHERGLDNLEVVTADVNGFATDRRFDRVVSIEMFEHVRNHALLLSRIAGWLRPGGKLFVHHFSHAHSAYPYVAASDDDWMARFFFSGGMMPSHDWLLGHQEDLVVDGHWRVDGRHYQKTSEAWLARQDERRGEILPILAEVYGADDAERWFQRWRLFFLACAELFGFREGQEWWVTHVRMAHPEALR